MQWQAMLKLSHHKKITPITHSLATITALKSLSKKNEKILPGVIISPMVSMQDALTKPSGKPLPLLGLPAFWLCSYSRWLPFLGPYPLASEKHHLPFSQKKILDPNKKKKNSSWKGAGLYYLPSSKYLLRLKGLEIANNLKKNIKTKPLGVVTKFDRIFSPNEQEKIFKAIDAPIYYHKTGHRWGTKADTVLPLVKKIVQFTSNNLKLAS